MKLMPVRHEVIAGVTPPDSERFHHDPERVESRETCSPSFDPFRVGKTVMAFPGALPPAINFVPFRVRRDLLKVLRSLLANLNEVDTYC